MSLMVLPTDVQIDIAGHLAATSDQPMNNLHSLWVTYSSMRHIYGNLVVGRCLALHPFRRGRMEADPIDYYALLASLT